MSAIFLQAGLTRVKARRPLGTCLEAVSVASVTIMESLVIFEAADLRCSKSVNGKAVSLKILF